MANVLIIDSDVEVAGALAAALKTRGVDSDLTADGGEGLKMARAKPPEVIVLCVELSRVSGYSICNKLKKKTDLARIPLILTSSQATEETFEQHKKLKTRAEQYLRKPYDIDELLGLIAQYTDLGKATGASPIASSVEMDVDVGDFSDDEELEVVAETDEEPHRSGDPSTLGPALGEPATVGDITRAFGTTSQKTQGRAAGAELDRARQEIKLLRGKVQTLEQNLRDKESEFTDRLLQESTRSREGVELKKRLAQLQREMQRHEQAVAQAKAKATETRQELAASTARLQEAEDTRDALSDKLGLLVDKTKQVAKERDHLRGQSERLNTQLNKLRTDHEQSTQLHEKAKRAVDIAVQLLDETGLLH